MQIRPAAQPLNSSLRNTGVLAGSSMVAILAGLVSAKGFALLLGPRGVGLAGLLQNALGIGFMIASLGLGVGLIREGAEARAHGEVETVAALRAAMRPLRWIVGAVSLLLIVAFSEQLSLILLGSGRYRFAIILAGIALLFQMAEGMHTSVLNAYHRVSAMARVNALSAAMATATGLMGAWRWGWQGVAPGMVMGFACNWLTAGWYVRREVGPATVSVSRDQTVRAARRLLRFGVPYAASQVAGAGLQLILPILVLHLLGATDVGYFRAAMAASVTYMGFLLNAMLQDYYPRVSAARGDRAALRRLMNGQFRLVLMVASPLVAVSLALARWLVPALYTPAFAPAVGILEWQLLGDLFKFGAFSMSYVVLAERGSGFYFVTEALGGLSTLAFTYLGIHLLGLEGLGVAFLASYAVYFCAEWACVRWTMGIGLDLANVALFAGAFAGLFGVHLLATEVGGPMQPVLLCALAGIACCTSGVWIARQFGGLHHLVRRVRGVYA